MTDSDPREKHSGAAPTPSIPPCHPFRDAAMKVEEAIAMLPPLHAELDALRLVLGRLRGREQEIHDTKCMAEGSRWRPR